MTNVQTQHLSTTDNSLFLKPAKPAGVPAILQCFVPAVELVLDSSANFCPFCRQKRGSNIVNTNETNKNAATKCLSFKNYAAKKTEERSTHFRSGSKKKAAKSKNVDPFALINIGIMRYVSPDVVTPVRGKTLALKSKKGFRVHRSVRGGLGEATGS